MSLSTEEKDHLIQKLSISCKEMQLSISDQQKTKLIDYLDNLLKWNKTYNLTAIRHADQGLIQHIVDCLSVINPLNQFIEKNQIGHPRILDVGSGGGLPGVVLAIICQNAKVTCIDTVEKKTSFIRQMSSVLKLDNLNAIHARIEKLEPLHADIVISRAFASLQDFAELAGKHVSERGKLIGMKGKNPAAEQSDLLKKGDWTIEKIEPLHVPELHAERCLVWMHRKEIK